MEAQTPDIIASLLRQSAAVALRLDNAQRICAAWNSELFAAWLARPTEELLATPAVVQVLERLLSPQGAAALQQQLVDAAMQPVGSAHDLGIITLRSVQPGAPLRHVSLSAHPQIAGTDTGLLLLLRDVSETHELQLSVTRAQIASETGMALLRAVPATARLFLGSAMASVSALRATYRVPARTQEALRNKLVRIHDGTQQLAQEAQAIELKGIALACKKLLESLDHRLESEQISGNDLLPMAPLIDNIAHAVGNAWRIEEQRHVAEQPVTTGRNDREQRKSRQLANWPRASERRWNQFMHRHGEELGKLAKLTFRGAEIVPASLRRDVDDMLHHVLRNALEHGIETPEQRLAANKPATGQISVAFEDKGAAGVTITVRDDGRGFDLKRIARAAVQCRLISEDSVQERNAVDLVGLIFKPAFTTEGLSESDSHGRGMSSLRNTVTRLNGQVSVATKPGRYTRFTIQLPACGATQQAPVAEQAGSYPVRSV